MTKTLITTITKTEDLNVIKYYQDEYPNCINYNNDTKEIVYKGPIDKIKIVCLNCGELLQFIDYNLLLWQCLNCKTIHAIIEGNFQAIKDQGKLTDWPELQNYFDNILKGL